MMAENNRQTACQQIAMLRSLRQQAAAKLLGITPRALRDHDALRNDDGSYDAFELTRWWYTTNGNRLLGWVLDGGFLNAEDE